MVGVARLGDVAVKPLEGVTVVSIEQAVAAPLATRQLAELGARVIKIERVGRGDFARAYDQAVDGLSSHFVWLNRSKESLALDIKDAAGREILFALLERADVFVQNLSPRASERLGLTRESLSTAFPRLITCSLTGYGRDGPYSDKKAYDLLIQAEAGLLSVTGTEEQPAKAGISVADIAAGMYVYSGILAALIQRGRTGEGSHLDGSLFDALSEWMGSPMYYAAYGSAPPARAGLHHATIAPYGPFTMADGEVVFIAVQNDAEWGRFCDLLGKPELRDDSRFASNTRRVEHRPELHAEIDALIRSAGLAANEMTQRLDGANIASSRMREVASLLRHPQHVGRGRIRDVVTERGVIEALMPPIESDAFEIELGAVPSVGEHGAALLAELGFEPRRISALIARGVVGGVAKVSSTADREPP
ncbi:MAG: CaiB/BaiF CoA-transferase family protein [Deinococcales bacterium]